VTLNGQWTCGGSELISPYLLTVRVEVGRVGVTKPYLPYDRIWYDSAKTSAPSNSSDISRSSLNHVKLSRLKKNKKSGFYFTIVKIFAGVTYVGVAKQTHQTRWWDKEYDVSSGMSILMASAQLRGYDLCPYLCRVLAPSQGTPKLITPEEFSQPWYSEIRAGTQSLNLNAVLLRFKWPL